MAPFHCDSIAVLGVKNGISMWSVHSKQCSDVLQVSLVKTAKYRNIKDTQIVTVVKKEITKALKVK